MYIGQCEDKAKAISAELPELNLKNKLEETGETRLNGKKQEEIGNRKKKHKKPEETG